MKKLDINDCHTILLEMVKEVHSICIRNRIPYYMLGGTMLGAVRHKGFIPWDDDMDLGIPRPYYKKFAEICKTELREPFTFLTSENSEYAVLGIGKVMNTRTILKEIYSVNTDEKVGIFIDVFPLDKTNKATGLFSCNRWMRTFFKLQKLMFLDAGNRSFYKKVLANCAQTIFHLDKSTLLNKIESISLHHGVKDGNDMYFNVYGAWGFKELIPMKFFGEPTLYKFEDIELFGVEDSDRYLKSLYGDYMKLPPESQQHIHYDNAFILD